LITVLVIVAGLLAGTLARNATALPPVDYYDLRGYAGNSVIYLNTGVVATMPISVIPNLVATGSQSQAPANDNINNVANLIVGSGHSTSSGNPQFQENFFGSGSNYLYVVIPFANLGATRMWWTLPPPTYGAATVTSAVIGVSVSNGDVASPNSPTGRWQVKVHTDTLYNSGVNVTGPNNKGAESVAWQGLASLALDVGCFIIPGYGFFCLAASQMLNLYGVLSGLTEPPTIDFLGNGDSFEKYRIIGGGSPVQTPGAPYGESKNVFATDMLIQVQIPYDPTANQFPFAPTFTFGATNWVADPNSYWDGYSSLAMGATASATLSSYPAVLVTGTVCQNARSTIGSCQDAQGLANQPVVLTTYNTGPYQTVNYHLTTDGQGRYSFFAPLNTPYQLSTIYSSPFGSFTAYSPWFTTNSQPNTQTINLQMPTIYGQVVSSSSNPHSIPGTKMTITNPVGTQYVAWTDNAGNYVVTVGPQGTYSIRAMAYGYQYATTSTLVNDNNGFLTNFGLIAATPDFSPTSCGTVYVYTDSGGSCAITINSNAGWQGNVVVTASQPSGSGAPTISGVSSPVWVPQFGTGTSVVSFASHGATGSWTVTVTVTSQDGTIMRQTTFTISVSSPPPPPPPRGCPPICPI
jgi:hypothetical protein